MKSTTTGGTRTRNPRLTRHFIHVEVHRLGGRCLIHWATVAHNRFKGMSARPIDAQVTYPNRMAHNRARKTVFADRQTKQTLTSVVLTQDANPFASPILLCTTFNHVKEKANPREPTQRTENHPCTQARWTLHSIQWYPRDDSYNLPK